MFDTKLLSSIDDLKRTQNQTYLISGHNMWQNIWFAELDAKGKELWHKDFSNNLNGYSRVLGVEDGYILSFRGIDNDKTIKLNKNREILYSTKRYFESMVELENGFIGVDKGSVTKVGKDGSIIWMQNYQSKFNQIVKLKDGNFVVLGKSDTAQLNIVKLSTNGTEIWSKNIALSKFYSVEGAVATKDGGFILNARGRIKILKFSSDGFLEFKTVLSEYYPASGNSIVQTQDGYITTSQINKSSDILVAKLKLDGNVLWKKIYTNQKRLHARNIVKAHDSGYLLSVTTEIHNPWLVKMDEKGKIESNFSNQNSLDDKTEYKTAKVEKKPTGYIKDISIFLGAEIRDMYYSKDRRYLYTVGGATGFKVFDISNKKKVVEIGSFLKTKLKLRVTPDYIGPIGRRYAGEGDLQYDSARTFVISKDEKKAYIADSNHGFYILDIEDKRAPKLLGTIKGLKVGSFVLSKDEKTMYTYYDAKLIKIDVSQARLLYKQEKKYTEDSWNNYVVDMQLSKSGENLFIADGKHLIVYSLDADKEVASYKSPSQISEFHISNDEKLFYLLKSNKGIEIVDIQNQRKPFLKNEIMIKGRYSSFAVSQDNRKLFLTGKEGLKVLDIKNPLNYRVIKTYIDEGKNYISQVLLDEKKENIFVTFASPSAIGILEYK